MKNLPNIVAYELQEVDLTEQTLTNSLLAITTDNKPKVYFTTGHEEFSLTEDLSVLSLYLILNLLYLNISNLSYLKTYSPYLLLLRFQN